MISATDNGLRIERIALRAPILPAFVRRTGNAISRAIERSIVAGAVRARESGDAVRFAAYMARSRALHMRFSAPSASQMAAAMAELEVVHEPSSGAEMLHHARFDDSALLVYVHGGSFIAARSPRLTALVARIAKAAGVADDAVTLLALTCRCPVLVCPAMNDA